MCARVWKASSALHHQEDGPASSTGHLSIGTEQFAVAFSSMVSLTFSNVKLSSRRFRVGLRISVQEGWGVGGC